MILTIDFNPSGNRTYIIEDKISNNIETRAKSSFYSPEGTGVTIARLLNIFSEKTLITGFLGGVSGELYHRALVDKGIIHRTIIVSDETRTQVQIIDEAKNKIILSERDPRITREKLMEFFELYTELLDQVKIIIGGSNLPQGVDPDIYFDLIRLANKKEVFFILDGVGQELVEGLEASPYAVVISRKELEKLIKITLNFENEIIKSGRYILDKGVKLLIINLYEKGLIVLEESGGYRVELPELTGEIKRYNNKGIVSGLALGINRNYDFEMTLKLSQAFNALYGTSDMEELDMSHIKKLMNKIEIYPINH